MASPADDIFQEETPTIVDCDVLEAAKENIQPLASGRRVTALSAVLATPHAQRDAKLSSTRKRLRMNVEMALEDPDDDPLEAYCRLVYWTVDNYPQGHCAESGLMELLEEATRMLKDDRGGVWKGEMKYLKLWVLYASFVERPTIIYQFLLVNDIGTSHALLYEEYAAVLERDGRRGTADEVYTLGVARQAAPLDHLQNRYKEFQKRMMCAAPLPVPVTTAATSGTKRTVLGTTSTTSSTVSTSRTSQQSTSIHRVSRQTATTGTASTSNGRMQIFVDPSGAEAEAAESSAWPDIGTRKTRIKENVPETKKIAGTTIKQVGKSKRLASASSGSRFVPYRDPVDDGASEMPPPDAPASKGGTAGLPLKTPAKSSVVPFRDEIPATPSFTPFRDESATTAAGSSHVSDKVMQVKSAGFKGPGSSSEAEALRKDPLKNYGAQVDLCD